MGAIKSALELALERTKDIEADRSGLHAQELKEAGMKLVVRFLEDPGFDLMGEVKRHSKPDLPYLLKGIRQNVESILQLPANQQAMERFQNLSPLVLQLANQSPMVQEYLEQLAGFYQRYLDHKLQITQAAVEQYAPMLRKKEETLSRQSGRRVQLQAEQDPEFLAFLNKNLQGLQEQFQQALDQVRSQIDEVLGW
jgi:predicted transcriptional regulator